MDRARTGHKVEVLSTFHLVPTNCLLVSAFFPCRCCEDFIQIFRYYQRELENQTKPNRNEAKRLRLAAGNLSKFKLD